MEPMISSDSHIVEPPDLWERWLTPEFRPRAPKLVQDEEGGDAWLYNDGGAPAPLGLVTVTRGRPREELRWSGARYSTINQGNFRGEARVEEMREDGVVAEVIYSPQRTMRHFMLGTEDDFQLAGIRAYNDWLAKDFCAKAPERLVGIAQMPSVGVDAAITEMKRAKALGLRGVLLSAWPSGNLNLSGADDPFFAEAEKLGLPVSIHIKPGSWELAAFAAVAPMQLDEVLAAVVMSGILERHERLRVDLGESGIGWVPYVLERMEAEVDKYASRMRDHCPS